MFTRHAIRPMFPLSSLIVWGALISPLSAQPNITFEVGNVLAGAGQSFEVPLQISFDGTDSAMAFSMAACIDPGVVIPTGFAAAPIGGDPPGFLQTQILAEGWTCSVLWDLASSPLSPGTAEVGRFLGDAPAAPTPASTPVELCVIGTPPIDTTLIINGVSLPPVILPGSIIILPPFRRGDTNDDGVLNIADAITLWARFSTMTTAPPITCDDAADANDDGQIDVADVVTILSFLFQGGSIPAPLEGCGPDETSDALDCAQAGNC